MKKLKNMSELYSIKFDTATGVLAVKGELTFSTVGDVLEQTQPLFEPATVLDVNLDAVTHSDSAGLVLLIHWMRINNSNNKKIIFQNIPEQMLAIAKASGLDELLSLQ